MADPIPARKLRDESFSTAALTARPTRRSGRLTVELDLGDGSIIILRNGTALRLADALVDAHEQASLERRAS